jgi:hypothetical protein
LLLVVVVQVVQHQHRTLACAELMVEHRASLVVVQRMQLLVVAVVVRTQSLEIKWVEMELQCPMVTPVHLVQVVVRQ